jgi:hypothetical protein
MKVVRLWDSDEPWVSEINTIEPHTWELGVTHCDRFQKLWSGNFEGFIQHRQLIPNNVKRG